MKHILVLSISLLLAATPASAAPANDVTVCFRQGVAPDTGIAACNRLIASRKYKGSDLASIHASRSALYARKGDLDRALADADARLRLTPVDATAFLGRGSIWLAKRDPDRALRDADEAIRIDPKQPGGYAIRGLIKHQQQDFDAAIQSYDEAIRRSPKTADLYTNRGNSWMMKNEHPRALADHDRAIALNPKNAVSLFNRAQILTEMGQLDRALTELNVVEARDSRVIKVNIMRGVIYRAKNNFPQARAAYDKAIATNRNLPSAWTGRGLVREATGDIDGAKSDYNASLALPGGALIFTDEDGVSYFDADWHRDQLTARARLTVLAASDGAAVKPAAATGPADSGRRVALVIGNSAYQSAGALPNAKNDAAMIARSLRRMGFEVSEGIDLDRAAMSKLLAGFLRGATGARTAVLFYAGHGVQIDGKNYLLPIDVRIDDAGKLASDMTDLDTILAGLDDQIRTNVVFLDACRDNPVGQQPSSAQNTSRSVKVRSGLAAPSGLGRGATIGAGTLLAFATAPGQVALDGDGENSPFTEALSRHISTPGLEVQQMLTRVRAEVVAATKNKQVPWSNSSLLGEVYLVGGKP